MKLVISLVKMSLRFAAIFGLLCSGLANADEYADINQLARIGKLTEALARADQHLAAQPKDPQMRFIKGVIQRDSGKTADAIVTFTRLTEDYPELPEPYNNLAVLYASQNQFDKARSALEMAIRTNPSYATAHENLGDIYAKLASQAYNKALQLDNGNQAVPPKLALIREIFGPAKLPTTVSTTKAPVSTNAAVAEASHPTAIIPTPPPKTTPVPAPVDEHLAAKEVEAAIAQWARAWSARDVKTYLAAYGKDFTPPGSMQRKAWEDERKARISSKAAISVKVDKLNVSVNGIRATANFRQEYKAGGLAVSNGKTLELTRVSDRWLIIKETIGE